MKTGPATSVKQFLDALPPERRAVMSALRTFIRRHVPAGYKEGIEWGAIGYSVPLSVLPDTYNGCPLCYVALAAKKNYYSLHLVGVYGEPTRVAALAAAFKRAGKRFDMGKACLRFKSIDDLPLDAIAAEIGRVPMKTYVARYHASRKRR